MGGVKIGLGVVVIIGLVVFYAVKGAVNTSGWDATIIALIPLIPLAMIVSGVLDLFGIRIKL